jgi:hypothetical protein
MVFGIGGSLRLELQLHIVHIWQLRGVTGFPRFLFDEIIWSWRALLVYCL